MRKLKNIFSWSLLSIYIIAILGFISEKHSNVMCNRISVNILDSTKSRFINGDDIRNLILSSNDQILGQSIKKINTEKIESALLKNGVIKTSEVFVTETGELHVEITQREPVVRIINKNNVSYYLDKEGTIIPFSKKYTSLVLVTNGYISEPFDLEQTGNIYTNTNKHHNSVYYDLIKLTNYIHNHEFWNSQIVQVYVNENKEFELIPRVGAHIILLGDISDYEEKFDKLFTLYTEWFNKNSWNDYLYINLKYKHQVVCSKI